MSSRDAQLIAKEQGVDLVEISANADPPVVKVIDWGKYQYQKMKEEAKNRKKAISVMVRRDISSYGYCRKVVRTIIFVIIGLLK